MPSRISRSPRWILVPLFTAITFTGMVGCISHDDDDRPRDNDRVRIEDHRGDYHVDRDRVDRDDHYDRR